MNSVRDTIFLFCLGLASLSSTTVAVCPYNVTACGCSLDKVQCRNLQEIPPLTAGSNVTTTEFHDGNITSVDIRNLPPGLVTLVFSGHPLTNISDNAFDNSVATLIELSITRSDLRNLPRALVSLTNLRYLTIVDTHIDIWDTGILQHIAKTLTSLQIKNVGLQKWPTWFSYFHSLTTTDLSQNPFGSIPNDVFNSNSNILLTLRLNKCNFTHIPEALSTLMNLMVLDISGNIINDVDDNPGVDELVSFPFAGKLTYLYAEAMGLTRIPDFSNMTRLQTIYLGYNQISNSDSIRFPLSLQALYLENNNLTSVPTAFAHIPYLYLLRMDGNQITELSFDVFPSDLRYLELRRNKVIKITDAISTHDSNLRSLYLQYNPINEIMPLAFKNLVYLDELGLQNTNLTSLPLALSSLQRLSTLRMQNISSLTCNSPPSDELVKWFNSRDVTINGDCNNGISINKYLSSWSTTTPVTTPVVQSSSSDRARPLTTTQDTTAVVQSSSSGGARPLTTTQDTTPVLQSSSSDRARPLTTTQDTTPVVQSSSSGGARPLTTTQNTTPVVQSSSSGGTTPLTTTQDSPTTTGGAALFEACWCCRYVCLLLLIPTCFYYI